jgi:prepilin-type N-terminal cleavage/methylation domain-containing protein
MIENVLGRECISVALIPWKLRAELGVSRWTGDPNADLLGVCEPRAQSRLIGQGRRGRGFSLVELALAMAIGAVLLGVMGGALMLTTSAADSGADGAGSSLQAADVGAQIGAELAVATSMLVSTPNDLAFTVPDRNGDGTPERIEYTWSGTAGAPLMRNVNGGTPSAVIASVRSINLSRVARAPAVAVESAERVLAQCDTASGSSSMAVTVDETRAVAQYVRPVLPAGAVAWRVTRVRVYLSQLSGNSKVVNVYLRPATAQLTPGAGVLASATVTSGGAPSGGGWVEFALPASGLGATQGVCITMEDTVDKGTFTVMGWQNGSNQPYNTHYVAGTGGASVTWGTPTDTKDLRFIVYGTVTTMVEP